MNTKLLIYFTASALAAGIVARPAPAAAQATQTTENYPGFMCNTRDVQVNGGSAATVSTSGQAAYTGSSSLMLLCPLVVPSGLGIQDAQITFWSNGYNLWNQVAGEYASVAFQVCDVYAGGGGGQCHFGAGQVYQGGSGVHSLTMTLPQFTLFDNQGNYDFLEVDLTGVGPSGSENVLFGYQATMAPPFIL